VTFDLDLLTVSRAQAPLVALLENLGYETLHRSFGYSNHSHPDPQWGAVDVVYVDDETARRLFSASTRVLSLGAREVPVPSAEHLIAMKVQALRNDPSRELQDLADIQYLLGIQFIGHSIHVPALLAAWRGRWETKPNQTIGGFIRSHPDRRGTQGSWTPLNPAFEHRGGRLLGLGRPEGASGPCSTLPVTPRGDTTRLAW
jgi:hypothetical protein